MELIRFGTESADTVLIQPVDEHDLAAMDSELQLLRENVRQDFQLIACKVGKWEHDLSPWRAPAIAYGSENFGDGAADTLRELEALCTDPGKTYYLGGYSLAGLFALWAAYQTDCFAGIAAASPSVWFPDFTEYMDTHRLRIRKVYLSLGEREERTRHPVMCKVGDCIRTDYEILREQGACCTLDWNPGGHFDMLDFRTAMAFTWLMLY